MVINKMYTKSITHYFVSFLLFCGLSASAIAQSNGTVQGNVYDKNTNAPIEYATISIFALPDSTLVTGIITDGKGQFEISDLNYGKYYVTASFIGFKETYSNAFTISESNKKVTVKSMFIEPESLVLDNVEVFGYQHQVDYKIDKKVITVNEKMTSASMSAIEVIETVPSIKVDVDGNVSLRGNSGFTVLIDGKPSVLDPSDVLRQIPASSIQSIEIITNPSAKYNPDGTGGIINIITKKNTILGWQGIINVKAGSFGMYGGDMLLSYRQKKINTFVGAEFSQFDNPRDEYRERQSINNGDTTSLLSNGTENRSRLGKSVRAGFEWDITEKDAFAFETKVGEYKVNNNSDFDFTTFSNTPFSDTVYESSYNNSGRGGQYIKLSSNYSHNFKEEKHQITAQAYYNYRQWKEYSETKLLNIDSIFPSGLYSTEDGPSSRFELKSDYTKPWTFGIIEAGIQFQNGKSEDDITLQNLDSITNSYIAIDSMTNQFLYFRNIYSAYGIVNGRWDKLEYKLGLRVENTQRDIGSESSNESYTINKWDLFPTTHASYKLSDSNQFMCSYSRRIERPRGYYLEPFITWSDMLHARKGNPNIQPEYINAFELGYIRKNKNSSVSLEAYYHIKKNKIEHIEELYIGEASLHTFENVGTDYSFGLDGMYNTTLAKAWEISCMGNVYHYRIVDENESSSINWSGSLHNTFRLKKNVKIQIDAMYHSPSVTSQGKEYGFYTVNGAIRADFFKRTLSASLQVRDIFAKANQVSYIRTENLYSYRKTETVTPNISINLSYKINNYKAKKPANSGESDEF